jgi:cytidyltransferase-like protein
MICTYQKRLKGEKIGVVFGTFAPLHQGHLDLIMQAKKECDGGCVVLVDGRDGDRVRTCSSCLISQSVNVYKGKGMFRYCPYCGSKMKGEE